MTMGRANRNDILDIIIKCHEKFGIPIDRQCKEWGNIVRERDVLREMIKRRAGIKPKLGDEGKPRPNLGMDFSSDRFRTQSHPTEFK